jgi:hypoxanthine phosphoribosyltransferase
MIWRRIAAAGNVPPMPLPRREIGWEEFGELMRGLALKVAPRAPDVVVGIARGGSIAGCTLSFLLGVDYYPVRLKKEGRATRVVVGPSPELKGRHVALVDDMSQSGETFKIATLELQRVGVKQVTTIAVVRREPGFVPDIFAIETAAKVRFPWAREQIAGGKLILR